jgi:hypothetical protein
VPPPPADAAVAEPDAGLPAAVTAAPAWIFHYEAQGRAETWTLQHAEGAALLVVESDAQPTRRYTGSATQGETLKVEVTSGTAKLALDCKPAKRPLSQKCNDKKAKQNDVLDCFVPDFKQPMPFGPAPGIEYVEVTGCKGYRLIAPEAG